MVDISAPIDISRPIDISPSVDVSSAIDISAPQPKGFFETLRNPLDLMRYESLPVALFQGLSGNTKEVQAKRAETFIKQNPNLRGSLEYLEAEAVLERYSYTLNDEPFSIDALKEAVKTNPGSMGG